MTAILEAFDEDDHGLRISELAPRADLPKSTVSRLVSTLVRERYLERDGKVIHLGLRLFELGQLAEQPRELRAAALPVMADLRNRTGETVYLAIRDGHEMVCIAIMRGPALRAPTSRIGGRLPDPCHRAGQGGARVLAEADVERSSRRASRPGRRRRSSIRQRLRRQLADIRRSGLAVEVGRVRRRDRCGREPGVLALGRARRGDLGVGTRGRVRPDRFGVVRPRRCARPHATTRAGHAPS